MIGSAVKLTFNDFLFNLAPIAAIVFILTLIPIYFIWGRTLHAAPEDREQVMAFDEREAITDVRLLKKIAFLSCFWSFWASFLPMPSIRSRAPSPCSAVHCCCCCRHSGRTRSAGP